MADPTTPDQRCHPGASPEGGEAVFRAKIGGMSCSFCTNTIRKAYERMDGVHEVGVSLAHEEGLVRYDPSKLGEDELRRTLEQVGYTYRDPDKVRSFEEEEEAELRTARNRLIVAGVFTAIAAVLMFLGMAPFWTLLAHPFLMWVMFALAVETMFITAWFVKQMAWASLRRGILNQHVLLEFGAFAGLVGGLLGIFVSPAFPAGHFFAVSVFITAYHLLSDYVSKVVRTRSAQAVRRLMELQPDTARVLRDGEEVEVPIDELHAGEPVRIRPGELVPVDGQVAEGVSTDESLVTGEPIPAEKTAGDEVIGGSVNQTGSLVVTVTRVGEESFLSQVARSIEEARALKPGVLQLVDTILKYFVPGVLVFAAAGFLAWTLGPLAFGQPPNVFRATFAALAVLLLGYPCALGMATPLAMIRGGGEAARQGILMRSGEAFQIMGEIRSMVLDKTGTLTRGEPAVQQVVGLSEWGEHDVLAVAASAESASEHPLARAIEAAAEARGLDVAVPDEFHSHTGKGVEATVAGASVLVGKPGFVAEQSTELSAARDRLAELEEQGLTVVAVARNGAPVGLIGIGDEIKPDGEETIRRMREAGITPALITGDNRRTAAAVAGEVGIERVLAEVLPDDKAAEVRRLQEGQRVAMVGDGINDAPALTQADVGIAIGAGTDIAIEAADIVIMTDRLAAVMDARDIGVRSYAKTKQNLTLAFAFNGIGVPAAATGFVHPIWAMVAMVASVSAVLGNSFAGRLLRRARRARDKPDVDLLEAQHRREHDHGGLETREESGHVEHVDEALQAEHAEPGKTTERAGQVEEATGHGVHILRLGVPMHCANCSRRIEERLGLLDGVWRVHADHAADVVEVDHTAAVFEGQIRAKLHDMGFDIRADEEAPR